MLINKYISRKNVLFCQKALKHKHQSIYSFLIFSNKYALMLEQNIYVADIKDIKEYKESAKIWVCQETSLCFSHAVIVSDKSLYMLYNAYANFFKLC